MQPYDRLTRSAGCHECNRRQRSAACEAYALIIALIMLTDISNVRFGSLADIS